MSNTFDKTSVLASFIEEVNSYLPEIATNLEHLAQLAQSAQSMGDMDAIEETYRRTHTIGGSASMMDFPGLSHVAHGMEDILGDALESIIVLDTPTISLLQRSLGRLHQLLSGIRGGINEEAVIAEDDADYVQYRTSFETTQALPLQDVPANDSQIIPEVLPPAVTQQPEEVFAAASMPSFDEVLASFRTSASSEDDETVWPEEPAQVPVSAPPIHEEVTLPVAQSIQSNEPISSLPSALDTLVASTRQGLPIAEVVPVEGASQVYANSQPIAASEHTVPTAEQKQVVEQHFVPSIQDVSLPKAYDNVQNDAYALVSYASSLKKVGSQLRSATIVIEEQRSEFRGFLDGSKDALDRMEDWAGQAMGLNLRNSPEQVRRYLPLSVMWVSNSKLKKVLELLNQITRGVELTDEQMDTALGQLTTSISACGEAFQHMQANAEHILTQESGWTPWEMQVTRDADRGVQERVTFERRGDLDTLRAEMETNVREELRREYEARTAITLAARAELEQQIRNEIRQEFEEKRRLQERAAGSGADELRNELETRLRSEIEIQVRQEFLSQIAVNADALSGSLMPPAQPAPTTANFADRARQATGAAERDERSTAMSMGSVPSTTFNSITSAVPSSAATSPQKFMSSVSASNNNNTVLRTPSTPALSGEFGEEATEIFRLEAEEHLQTISTYVAALEKEPTNRDFIQGIRRATHTLKGAAAMMGFRAIAELSHVSEDLLDSIMEGKTPASSDALSIILDTAETLDILITGRDTDNISDEARVQVLRVRYANLLGEYDVPLSVVSEDIDEDIEESEGESVTDTPTVAGIVAEQPETNAQRANRQDLSVRVRLQKLDELVNLFGELLVNRSVLEERIEHLVRLVADVGISSNRLRDVGQKLESRFEAATLPSGRSVIVMPGEGTQTSTNGKNGKNTESSHLADFDALEMDRYTEFHQVARGLSEGISDMATLSTEMDAIIRECEGVFARENRLSTTVQERLMKTRLVPLSTMTPRLYRAARAVALKQHKEFEFMLEGEETEIDRTVFEEIAGPLLHLIRNAVNHGIETPEVRTQHGKTPKGQITLAASYEGNQVVITVREDGRGIDPEQVRQVAIARGLIRPEHVLSENELVELIFHPGFSTAEVLSEESGRGVGLDVVRDSVSRLRGTIEVESTPGQGTAFTMKFPTSLAIQGAMMVRVNDQQFAIPIVMVESIGRLDTFKRTTVAGQPAIVVRNDLYPLSILAQYLALPTGQIDEKSHVLLVNASGNHVALVIDEVKGKLDIVMKNLGPHLRHVHGIAGGTVLGNGQVVLILELAELLLTRTRLVSNKTGGALASTQGETVVLSALQARQVPQTPPLSTKPRIEGSLSQQVGAFTKPPANAPKTERGKHILVVDDSPSVRRVVGNMLKQHGWEVQMARDGVEALEMISRETPAAVLLDVEMPRMDGYELIATVRAQEQYRTLPLIMLTSRAAAKHQQRAMQLGASAYLVKPYQDDELLNILNSLVYGAVVR
ncbi:MAG: hypothetical protein NVS4B11_08810 [Ktedonobacteraceae bacterium]